MSITSLSGGKPYGAQPSGMHATNLRPKVTTTTIQDKKQRHQLITCLTAYDYATARLVDQEFRAAWKDADVKGLRVQDY